MTLINKLKYKILKIQWDRFYSKYQLPEKHLFEFGVIANEYKPSIIENICMPPYLGDSNLNDYSILFSLMEYIEPKVFLEFGTAYGNTVANICAQHNSKVFTVNALPEQIEGRVKTYTLTKNDIGKEYRQHGYSARIKQIYANTKNINLSNYLQDYSINFAIIDACHDADFVVNDFLKVLPFMEKDSIVLLHDTHPSLSKHYIDSYIGCMYLRKLGFDIKHIKESSWAIWLSAEGYIEKGLINRIWEFINSYIERLVFGDIETDIKEGVRKIV